MKKDAFISTDVYIIPIGNWVVVYAPLRKLAFMANTTVVNFLYRLRNGQVDNFSKEEETFLRFLEDIRLVGEEGDTPIVTFEHATFKPTAVTLFLTTRCNPFFSCIKNLVIATRKGCLIQDIGLICISTISRENQRTLVVS